MVETNSQVTVFIQLLGSVVLSTCNWQNDEEAGIGDELVYTTNTDTHRPGAEYLDSIGIMSLCIAKSKDSKTI